MEQGIGRDGLPNVSCTITQDRKDLKCTNVIDDS